MINIWIWVKDKFPQESIEFWINKNTQELYISTSTKISSCLVFFVLLLLKEFNEEVEFCDVDDEQLTNMFFDLDSQDEEQ